MADVRETNTAAAAKSAVPNFKDNPIQTIGLALQNFAAGFRGQPLPSEILKQQDQERRLLEMKQLGLTLDAVQKGVELYGGADPNSPEIQNFIGKFSEALPGFGDAFNTAMEISNDLGISALEGAGEHMEKIYSICGLDRECIKKTISDSNLMKRFDETADSQRMPSIIQKFQAITEAVGGEEKLQKLISDGTWTLGDLRQLPEGFQFTKEEMRTISRNQDIQNALIEYGFEPPEIQKEALKSQKTSALGMSIDELVRAGVPRSVAAKIKTGAFKGVTDSFGRASVVDLTTGQTVWPPAGEKPKTPDVETPTVEITGGSEGTGGSAVMKNFINYLTDFFGGGLQFREAAEATDQLERLRTFTTLGLSGSLAGRDTNMVRELILNLFPEPSSLKFGDERSLSKLKAVRDQIQFELDGQQRIAESPGEFTPEMAQDAVAATHNLGRLVEMYNGVIDNWYAKPGEKTGKFGEMSDEELGKVEITDENASEILKEIERRMGNGKR